MKALKIWAYVVVVLAFVVLIAGVDLKSEYALSASVALFFILITALVLYGKSFLIESDGDSKPKKKKDPLKFIITYIGPLSKETKVVHTSDQVKIRNLIEKLTKMKIDYEIQIEIKNSSR